MIGIYRGRFRFDIFKIEQPLNDADMEVILMAACLPTSSLLDKVTK